MGERCASTKRGPESAAKRGNADGPGQPELLVVRNPSMNAPTAGPRLPLRVTDLGTGPQMTGDCAALERIHAPGRTCSG